MKSLFEVTKVDCAFYEERLREFLPDQMLDIHTHVWRKEFVVKAESKPVRRVSWPDRVAAENPVEHLIESYRLMFPGKRVTPLMFTTLVGGDYKTANAYIGREAKRRRFPSLIFSLPRWSGAQLEDSIAAGGFLGAKSYLTLSEPYLPEKEIRIYDFFPPHQLEALNRHGWILMLHIPRDGRLRDPVNLAQLVELEERYPKMQVIVAHVGRAYCPEDVGNAFDVLRKTQALRFDISANTHEGVFRQLIEAVGPKRILFGSDLPITRMRMRRICEHGNYVNLVPKGLYGDVSGDKHMREVAGAEAKRLTFFMYEELDAFRRAAEAANLSRTDIEDVFYRNASAILERAGAKPVQQLRMFYPVKQGIPKRDMALPKGYELRTYRDGDGKKYIRLMQRAGFTTWSDSTRKDALRKTLPGGIFFIVHKRTGTLAATAGAMHHPTDEHPFGGELGWVACDPDHRGKGLGGVVCMAVVKRFLEAGYRNIYLQTDDFRLPAIKTYLKLGWKPLLFAPDMDARWKAVFQQLKIT